VANKTFLFLLILTLFFPSFSAYAQDKENLPVVHFAYAQEKIRQGEIWKIYLSVSDPNGNMSRIACNIEQAGAARLYKPSLIYLKKGMEKQFVGYLALYTNSSQNLSGEELTVNLSILDRQGNVRKALSSPLEIDGDSTKSLPADTEKELNRRIGIIDVDFDVSD